MFYDVFNSGHNYDFELCPSGSINCSIHLQNSYEFFLVIDGQTDVIIDGTCYTVTPGEAVVIFPFQFHSFITESDNVDSRLAIFTPDYVPQFVSKYKNRLPVSNKIIYDGPSEIDFRGNFFRRQAFCYTVLALLTEQTDFIESTAAQQNQLAARIMEYLSDNYNRNCSLRSLADYLNYDYTYISKYFKSRFGLKFNDYINRLRTSHAELLLNSSDKTIAEIAHECGYSSIRTFNTEFKLLNKCTPSQYRASRR